MNFKFNLFFFIFLISRLIAVGQYKVNYHPEINKDSISPALLSVMKKRLEDDKYKALYSTSQKNINKYKATLYDERYEEVMKRFRKGYFLIDDTLTRYLRSIADKIYKANPQLKNETRIYAYRSEIPNATSYGDGTIGFNQGLIAILENESQIAFILSHELAHYHLRHSDRNINKIAELNFDKDIEKKIKEIKNSSSNQYAKIKVLLKDMNFSNLRHSRSSENEADSAGLSYLMNSGYNSWEAVRAMEILDSCDVKPLYPAKINLKKNFSFPDYPFQDSWLAHDSSDYIYAEGEKMLSDTGSTHPDCKKRIRILDYYLHMRSVKKNPDNISDSLYVLHIKTLNNFELLESLYHNKNLGMLLMFTMQLLEAYPDNCYLHAMVGKCLTGIYTFEKTKELGKVVTFPDIKYDKNENQIYTFIYNLRISELEKISFKYMYSKQAVYSKDEEFLYSLILSSKLPASSLNSELLISDYKKKFPKGKYLSVLNSVSDEFFQTN